MEGYIDLFGGVPGSSDWVTRPPGCGTRIFGTG
jgi:hypothetical protein